MGLSRSRYAEQVQAKEPEVVQMRAVHCVCGYGQATGEQTSEKEWKCPRCGTDLVWIGFAWSVKFRAKTFEVVKDAI